MARCGFLLDNRIGLNDGTLDERVARVTWRTQALWRVADDAANGVRPARVRARIFTLLIYTGQVAGAFAVADALRSTVWWYPKEVWQAGT